MKTRIYAAPAVKGLPLSQPSGERTQPISYGGIGHTFGLQSLKYHNPET